MEPCNSQSACRPSAQAAARPRAIALRRPWPQGAVTGLVLVALCCAGIAALSYALFGPAQVIASEPPGADWSLVEARAAQPES